MPNTRELSGLASDLGGYWGQEGSKDNGSGAKKKGGAKKKSTITKKAATSNLTAQPYTGGMTRKEAGFSGDGEEERVFLPRTALGHKVDQYLYIVFCEEEEHNMCAYSASSHMT